MCSNRAGDVCDSQGDADTIYRAVAAVTSVVQAKTKRLKQREHRAASRVAKSTGASELQKTSHTWPDAVYRVAVADFQMWRDDVFMWCANRLMLVLIKARGLTVTSG